MSTTGVVTERNTTGAGTRFPAIGTTAHVLVTDAAHEVGMSTDSAVDESDVDAFAAHSELGSIVCTDRGIALIHHVRGAGSRYGMVKTHVLYVRIILKLGNGICRHPVMRSLNQIEAVEQRAAAFGHLGNANHPDVQEAFMHVFRRARAAGKAAGILAGVEADARRYLDWGATFVAVGSDLGLFRAASQALCDRFKQAN